MIQGFVEGVLGGLFGDSVSRWLGKYRYWVAFFIGFSLIPAAFGAMAIYLGWDVFIQRSASSFPQDFPFIIGLSIGMGLTFVVMAALGRWQTRMNAERNNKKANEKS